MELIGMKKVNQIVDISFEFSFNEILFNSDGQFDSQSFLIQIDFMV